MRVELMILGGAWDGLRGLEWDTREANDDPAPETIIVGECPGDSECGWSMCMGERHPAYWIPEEEFSAERATTYRKADEHTVRVGRRVEGRAIYSPDGQLGGHRPELAASVPLGTVTSVNDNGGARIALHH